MVARIAISDPLPAFRRGVMAILRDAGYDAEAPTDLLAWVQKMTRPSCCFSAWSPLRTGSFWRNCNSRTQDAVVVALLDDMSVRHVRALTYGAVAAMPRNSSPDSIRETFGAILSGRSLVPIAVLRALLQQPAEQDADRPSARERAWLRDLAGGMTVNELAAKAGYSERMMFRLLRELYSRFGARTKVRGTHACARAGVALAARSPEAGFRDRRWLPGTGALRHPCARQGRDH